MMDDVEPRPRAVLVAERGGAGLAGERARVGAVGSAIAALRAAIRHVGILPGDGGAALPETVRAEVGGLMNARATMLTTCTRNTDSRGIAGVDRPGLKPTQPIAG